MSEIPTKAQAKQAIKVLMNAKRGTAYDSNPSFAHALAALQGIADGVLVRLVEYKGNEHLWAHADGSAHSATGPAGCFPCANLRRAARKAAKPR